MGIRNATIVAAVLAASVLVGGIAAASTDGAESPDPTTTTTIDETTTTLDETTTTVEEPTTTTTAEPATTTTEAPPTTEVPEPTTTVPAGHERGPDPNGPAKHGLCRAFAGRDGQPGSSQAYARLYEAAGGDIDGFCADVLAGDREARDDRHGTGGDDAGSSAGPAQPGRSGKGTGTGRVDGAGHGKGAGQGKGAGHGKGSSGR